MGNDRDSSDDDFDSDDDFEPDDDVEEGEIDGSYEGAGASDDEDVFDFEDEARDDTSDAPDRSLTDGESFDDRTEDEIEAPADFRIQPGRRVQELLRGALKSALWETVQAASQLTPVGGFAVPAVYLARQVWIVVDGLGTGDGFTLKVTIPGLDGLLPHPFELVASYQFAGEHPEGIKYQVEAEIFEPGASDVDVEAAEEAGERTKQGRMPPAEDADQQRPDPWQVWLALIGFGLVRDLANTLAVATRVDAGVLLDALRRQYRAALGDLGGRGLV